MAFTAGTAVGTYDMAEAVGTYGRLPTYASCTGGSAYGCDISTSPAPLPPLPPRAPSGYSFSAPWSASQRQNNCYFNACTIGELFEHNKQTYDEHVDYLLLDL